jgi:hypothetical protein
MTDVQSDKADRDMTSLIVVGPVRKLSTAMCSQVFDELEMALVLLEAGDNYFNSIQRELVDHFASACKTFARNMLAAEGNQNALRMMMELPPVAAQ